ncbi:hypothetical protein BDZ90DRAFT_46323 [Jaminaea rosea]|uniref:DUF6533 domain-containing protein n=1 Tax=Jaminaea rosea TaxID=1569628 RepID=A0A316USP1_9BASI|nr:hypothetical protein BDZ90DRAFT_46323 [Jaminaea rosea]PWN26155.1 hypothetical protein BDZ90DRAFT_46323 [Jaminaea rosea]
MVVSIEAMRVCTTVAFSCFATEWLCSLGREIKYIWKARFCLLTACFLGARYITLINLTFMMAMFHGSWTASLCDRLYLVMPILATLGLLCAEGVCCIRIWTIHKRSRFIFSFLATLFTAMAGIQFYAISKYVAFRDETGSCIAAGQGVWLALYWLAPATLDLILLFLAIFAVGRETRQYGANRLLDVILRDQVFYFLFVFSGCIISGVLMTVNSAFLQSLNNPPAIAVPAIGATRLVLSLKSEGMRQMGVYRHGQDSSGSSGRKGLPKKKGGVLSWWSTRDSGQDIQKASFPDSPAATTRSNNRSWLQIHPGTWTSSMEARKMASSNSESAHPLTSSPDVELASFGQSKGDHTFDSIEVHQAPVPPTARCKTSSTFWSGQRGVPGSVDENGEYTTSGKGEVILGPSIEVGRHQPHADERLIGLGDNTMWPHSKARRMASCDQIHVPVTVPVTRNAHTATGTRDSSRDTFGGHNHTSSRSGTRLGSPTAPPSRGQGNFMKGCAIHTETTTFVTRGSEDYSQHAMPQYNSNGNNNNSNATALRPDTANDPYQQHVASCPTNSSNTSSSSSAPPLPTQPRVSAAPSASYVVAEDSGEDTEAEEVIGFASNTPPASSGSIAGAHQRQLSWQHSASNKGSEETMRAQGPQ